MMKSDERKPLASPLNMEWTSDLILDDKEENGILGDDFLEENDGSIASAGSIDLLNSGDDGNFKSVDLLPISSDSSPTEDPPPPQKAPSSSSSKSIRKRSCSGPPMAFSKRQKKAKGMPKRPLSAYNLYFKSERAKIMEEKGGEKVGFEDLGKIIGKKWKELSVDDRRIHKTLAEEDSERYRKEMETYRKASITKESVKTEQISTPMQPQVQPYQRTVLSFPGDKDPAARSPMTVRMASGPMEVVLPPSPSLQASTTSTQAVYSYSDAGGRPTFHHKQYGPAQQVGSVASSSPQTSANVMSFPPPPANAEAMPGSFPVPEGMDIFLSDRNGQDRKYRVQYKCYSMPRQAAHDYVQRISSGAYNSMMTPNIPHSNPGAFSTSGISQQYGGPPQAQFNSHDPRYSTGSWNASFEV